MTTNKALEKIDEMIKTLDKEIDDLLNDELDSGQTSRFATTFQFAKEKVKLCKSLAEQAIQEDRERIINECNKYRIRYFYGADDIAFNNVIKIVNGEKVE